MASSTVRNGTAEIIAPAGNKEKLETAVAYGAQSVYFGGPAFNLRVKADNFSIDELIASAAWCRERKVTTIFLLNAFMHELDIPPVTDYLKIVHDIRPDAIMVSDPGMAFLIREAGITTDLHLSTQMSTLNHHAVNFWHQAGFKRIVLGREATLEEIRLIADATDAEIEVFAHGALCIAYSGRCLLSRYMTGRDANQGDCAQSCRWNYSLVESKRPGNFLDIIEHDRGTEIISSKDLKLIEHLEQYIEAGVTAFKLEGRMKSLYHAAQTTRIYGHAARLAGTDEFKKYLPFWNEELDLINHRPYTDDLFNEYHNLPFTGTPYVQRAMFIGYRLSNGTIKVFNPFKKGEKLEAIYPIHEKIIDHETVITHIADSSGQSFDAARPREIYTITCDPPLGESAILRKRMENST